MTKQCPTCGDPIDEQTAGGLCPNCLLGQGLRPTEASGSAGGPHLMGMLDAQQLAPHFEDLELDDLVGYGGMGAVYACRQKKLDRRVALKVIHPRVASDPAFAERFQREARTMARLSHPHIVTIHDFGQFQLERDGSSETLFYILMEFVDGTDLRRMIDSRQLQPQQALEVTRQICDALQFAHDAGIVHRDIKPENVLIDVQGNVRIVDFGLAKLADGNPQDFTLTGTHQIVGTPRYMAPEQLEGAREVDHRADLYSLGVVLYEMLTGELPLGRFDLPSQKAKVRAQVDDVVLRTLAKEPARRYQQASEIRSDVDSLGDGSATGAGLTAQPRRENSEGQTAPRELGPSDFAAAGSLHAPTTNPVNSAYTVYSMTMFLLGAAAFSLLFVAWTSLQMSIRVGGHSTTYGFSVIGHWYWVTYAPCLLGLAVTLRTYIVFLNGRILDHSRALLVISTGFGLLSAGAICQGALPVINIRGEPIRLLDESSWRAVRGMLNDAYDGRSEIVVSPDFGVVLAVALGGLLLACGVWELHTLCRDETDAKAAMERCGRWMFRVAILSGPVLLTLMLVNVRLSLILNSPWLLMHWTLIVSVLLQTAFCLVILPIQFLAAGSMTRLSSRWLALLGAGSLIMFWGPLSMLGIPVGVWSWLMLGRQDVREAFSQSTINAAESRGKLQFAGRVLAWSGLANFTMLLAGGIILIGVATTSRDRAPLALLVLMCSVTGLIACLSLATWRAGVSMQSLRSHGMAKLALTLAIVPMGPAWLVSLPTAVWARSVLGQPLQGAKHSSDLFDSP